MAEFIAERNLPASPEAGLEWHARPGALERLLPPWSDVRVMQRDGTIAPGGRVALRVRRGLLSFDWVLDHVPAEGGLGFADVQRRGPFRTWRHDHLFRRAESGGCILSDRVRYTLPPALAPAEGLLRRDLEQLFRFRHRTTSEDLAALNRAGPTRPLTVAISGSHGLLGSALGAVLGTAGHRVVRLVRSVPRHSDEMQWHPSTGLVPHGAAQSLDAVVHLAGESIAGGLWTADRMRRIRESRTTGTRALATSLARLSPRPAVLICAAAVGYYGERGDEVLDESSASGDGFLAGVAREWEAAAEPAAAVGIRTVNLRFAPVLSPRGGLLAKMLLPFRLGVGGNLGSGRQWMSWVTLDDAAFAALHALHCNDLRGPVNVTAPEPVTNAVFTRTLARVLGRPAFFPVPKALLRAIAGRMADEMFLVSQRAIPSRLPAAGFCFRDPALEPALRHLLGR